MFHASLLASGDGWQSWAFFGSVDVYHLNISLYPHGVFSLSLCSHVAIFWVLLFFKVFKKISSPEGMFIDFREEEKETE